MDEQHNYQRQKTEKSVKKNAYNLFSENIEPWMDEPHNLPLELLKTEAEKFIKKQNKLRRYVSLEIHSKSTSVSPKKQRPSKMLPKMNIGNMTSNHKNPIMKLKTKQSKEVLSKRKSEVSLPAVSVTRQLMIERKLYLMKNKEKDSSASPSPRRSCLRSLVDKNIMKKN